MIPPIICIFRDPYRSRSISGTVMALVSYSFPAASPIRKAPKNHGITE